MTKQLDHPDPVSDTNATVASANQAADHALPNEGAQPLPASDSPLGTLWGVDDNAQEALATKLRMEAHGATVRLVPRTNEPLVDVYITLERSRAAAVFGRDIDDDEWLTPEATEPAAVFDFLPQPSAIEALLTLCVANLSILPDNRRDEAIRALRRFEEAAALTMWSVADVTDQSPLLDKVQRRNVIANLVENYEPTDTDWSRINWQIQAEGLRDARRPERHLLVSYSIAGRTCEDVLVPLALCDVQVGPEDQMVEAALRRHVDNDDASLIGYDGDTHVDASGQPIA